MRIPFTLDAWLKNKSQKVETKDGRPVKIISFEMTDTNDCPIAAQFRLCAGTPVVYLFDKEGHYKGEGDSDYDLFIVTPEPELTEFEKEVSKYRPQSDTVETIQRIATELLSLARNEFNKQIESDYREIIHGAYKRGKADAEQEVERRIQSGELLTQEHHEKLMETLCEECKKDLPRWKIWRNGACGNSEGHAIALVAGAGGIRFVSVLGAIGEKYIMLDDLKKLPGFNDEDHE